MPPPPVRENSLLFFFETLPNHQNQNHYTKCFKVIFNDIKECYSLDLDLEVSYTLTSATQPGLGDRICLYKLPHLQPHEHVAFVWAANSEEKTLKAKFPVSALPKEVAFYQLQYLKRDNNLAGSSIPFQLTHREKDHIDVLTSDKLPTQTAETQDRTKNDLTTTREELVKVQQCLKQKEYRIFELENKLNNRTNVTINESKMLTMERDSLKNERDILRVELTQGKDSNNKLKMMLVGATLLLSILLAVGIKLKLQTVQTEENIKLLTKEIQLNGTMAQKTETLNRLKNDLNTAINENKLLTRDRDSLKNDLNTAINENKLLTRDRDSLKNDLNIAIKQFNENKLLTRDRDSLKNELDKVRLDLTQGKDSAKISDMYDILRILVGVTLLLILLLAVGFKLNNDTFANIILFIFLIVQIFSFVVLFISLVSK